MDGRSARVTGGVGESRWWIHRDFPPDLLVTSYFRKSSPAWWTGRQDRMEAASSVGATFGQCLICKKIRSPVLLYRHEEVIAWKLFQICRVPIQKSQLNFLCESCIEKLYVFKKLLKSLVLTHRSRIPSRNTSYLLKRMSNGKNLPQLDPDNNNTKNNATCTSWNEKVTIKTEKDCEGDIKMEHATEENFKVEESDPEINFETETPTLVHALEPQPSTSTCVESDQSDTSGKSPGRRLKCQYCQKEFSHKGDFNKHLRIHTKEKPFSCSTCKRRFSNASNLSRHLRIHSGNKPFVCTTCNKTFSRKDKLDCHKGSKFCRR